MAARGGRTPTLASMLGLLAWAGSLAGCGDGGDDGTRLGFPDPVVEARVRRLLVQRFEADGCAAVWGVTAAEVGGAVSVDGSHRVDYPVRPEDLLPDGPGDHLHVAAEDVDGRVVARACGPAGSTLRFYALPPCDGVPDRLDLAVVFDGSDDMALASAALGGVAEAFRADFVEAADFPPGSELSLWVHRDGDLEASVTRSAEGARLADALAAAEPGFRGLPTPFLAIMEVSRVLRDRASCARQPVMLVISAGPSADDVAVPADAAFGLYASQGDPTDDVFTFGIGIGQDVVDELALAIPEEVGEIRGASTAGTFGGALREANLRLRLRTE